MREIIILFLASCHYIFVTITVYTVSDIPFVTITVIVFSPLTQAGEDSLLMTASPSLITTSAIESLAVAVTLFVALLVVTEYSNESDKNSGLNTNAPIVNADNELSGVIPPLVPLLFWHK